MAKCKFHAGESAPEAGEVVAGATGGQREKSPGSSENWGWTVMKSPYVTVPP